MFYTLMKKIWRVLFGYSTITTALDQSLGSPFKDNCFVNQSSLSHLQVVQNAATRLALYVWLI